ncbi:hypothetical protein FNV43_RR13244 [Rhamnella rubrinervis]|uniref:Uncharacterized protein n=1 Tax=Rhamnella rubrinervis TaxID=2594499 RepID=A0A8K0MEX3_9ROSA|nr:hypothetical protein FNV43_RR13244 [Rhamnella rubrinervis]
MTTTTTTTMNACGRRSSGGKVRKGYVPVLVGTDGDKMEKLWLPTKLITHPHVVALLNTSADEFGYAHHQGIRAAGFEFNPSYS